MMILHSHWLYCTNGRGQVYGGKHKSFAMYEADSFIRPAVCSDRRLGPAQSDVATRFPRLAGTAYAQHKTQVSMRSLSR
jgi:hypothetical protein